jgi:DNA-binding CsgD family transcriptional regulator
MGDEPPDLERLALETVDRVRDVIGADAASMFLWRDDLQLLVPVLNNDPGWDPRASRSFRPGEGVTGSTFRQGAPLIIDDYPEWSGAVSSAVSQGVKSGIAVPLVLGARPVGVLSVRSYHRARWNRDHVRLLRVLATLAAPALASARHMVRRPCVRLTPRETQVLGDIMAGRSAKAIAGIAGIAEATVRVHIRSVLSKFGVHSQVAAVAMARQMGFTPTDHKPDL